MRSFGFQFPSNGKAYPKFVILKAGGGSKVSIPFKRESISKEIGKACLEAIEECLVSIPFKRESISKVGGDWKYALIQQGVSIPFKRESISKGGLHFC